MSVLIARSLAVLSALAIVAVATPAFADIYFLEYAVTGSVSSEPTGVIKGTPVNTITVTSFSFGVAKPVAASAAGTETGKPALEALTVTGVDSATAQKLFQYCLTGRRLSQVRLVIAKNIRGQIVPSEIILMKDAYVTSATMNATNAQPTDTYDFNYAAVVFEESQTDATATSVTSWHITRNRPVP